MARTQRVIASGGTPVAGVPFTSSRATGRQVQSTLGLGGVPVRTTGTAPVQGTRPVSQQIQGPGPAPAPTRSIQATGQEIAFMLRSAGIPARTTGGAPPVQGTRPVSTPIQGPAFEVPTVSQELLGSDLIQMLRLGGQPVQVAGQETFATQTPAQTFEPAVDPHSAADPRAGNFSPEPAPATEPVTRVERLTGEQLKQMGVPVQTALGPVTPEPSETKQRPPSTVITGGAPPVAGVPWSSQSGIPSVALQSSQDPYAGLFG